MVKEFDSNSEMVPAKPLSENDDEEGDDDKNPLHDTLRKVHLSTYSLHTVFITSVII